MLGANSGTVRLLYTSQESENLQSTNLIPTIDYNLTASLAIEAGAMFSRYAGSNMQGLQLTDVMAAIKIQHYQEDIKGKTYRLSSKLSYMGATGQTHAAVKTSGANAWGAYGGFLAGYESLAFGSIMEGGISRVNYPGRVNGTFVNLKVSAGFPLLPHKFPIRQINTYIEVEYLDKINARSSALLAAPGLQIIWSTLAIEFFYQKCVIKRGGKENYPLKAYGMGLRLII